MRRKCREVPLKKEDWGTPPIKLSNAEVYPWSSYMAATTVGNSPNYRKVEGGKDFCDGGGWGGGSTDSQGKVGFLSLGSKVFVLGQK